MLRVRETRCLVLRGHLLSLGHGVTSVFHDSVCSCIDTSVCLVQASCLVASKHVDGRLFYFVGIVNPCCPIMFVLNSVNTVCSDCHPYLPSCLNPLRVKSMLVPTASLICSGLSAPPLLASLVSSYVLPWLARCDRNIFP